jgi:hypothetical protein
MRFATIADKETVEAICNHPLIRVWTAFEGASPCEATPYLTPPSFTVMDERGCFLAQCIDPGRYVIHTNLLPECRGSAAIEAIKEALNLIFVYTDADELLTMVPVTIPHARVMAKSIGFRHLFDRPNFWPANGSRHEIGFYSLSFTDWATQGNLPGSFVAIVRKMILAGNGEKGVDAYNRFARFAMFETAEGDQFFMEAPHA